MGWIWDDNSMRKARAPKRVRGARNSSGRRIDCGPFVMIGMAIVFGVGTFFVLAVVSYFI